MNSGIHPGARRSRRRRFRSATLVRVIVLLVIPASVGLPRAAEKPGEFIREYWYERGTNFGNPKFDRRFRVNAAEVVLHPEFGNRIEVRENGMMQILAGENLNVVTRAELYLELWGGHPGTANKRVTINGRSTYPIPEVGTAQRDCTHEYPAIELKRTDLVNGYNAIQFACDQGSSFWGHFIVDNACLRIGLPANHPALASGDLAGFHAAVAAATNDMEQIELRLIAPVASRGRIARVDFQGFYTGYDENGDGVSRDWHGFTKSRQPQAFIGSSTQSPFRVLWDTRMLPRQEGVRVKAFIRFHDPTNLFYVARETAAISFAADAHQRVRIVAANEQPRPFWSRAGKKMSCTIQVDSDPAQIERAELHVVIWDGGAGDVRDYFTLNGVPLAIGGGGKHDVLYRVVPIDPKWLRKGDNTITLLSDTSHHGIEVLRPGPALVVRHAP